MASKNTYVAYAADAFYEPQFVYMEGNSKKEIMEKLRELGARRVLFVTNTKIATYKNFEDLMKKYEGFGFRCFSYKRGTGLLTDLEIDAGIKVYREYNCDTIITVGGSYEIDCGKLISARATNDVKSLSDFAGVNNIKHDISLVCCIVTDNSTSAAQPHAEFLDSQNNKWLTSMSSYLIPQVVVLDFEICQRLEKSELADGLLTSLCVAIETYVSPVADFSIQYKANAVTACILLLENMDKMLNNPDDVFVRKCIAVGNYYAGLSNTRTGLGYTHIVVHSLMEKYGNIHGAVYMKLLCSILRRTIELNAEKLSELSKQLHFCSNSVDSMRAAEIFIEKFENLSNEYSEYNNIPVLDEVEIKRILEDVRRDSVYFELKKMPVNTISDSLKELSVGV